MRPLLLIFVCLFSFNAYALGITTSWNGTISSDFNLAGNWSAGVPGPADTANIAGTPPNFPVVTSSVTIDTLNLTALELDINPGVTLTVNTTATFDGSSTLGQSGTLILLGTGTLSSGTLQINFTTVDASAALASFSITAGTTLNNSGNLIGTFLLFNAINFTSGRQAGTMTIKTMTSPVSIGGGGPIMGGATVNLLAQNPGVVNMTSTFVCNGTFNMNAFFDCVIDVGNTFNFTINGTLNMNGAGNNIAKLQGAGGLLIGGTGTLNSTAATFPNVISCSVSNGQNMNALAGETDLNGAVTSFGTMTATAAGTSFGIGATCTLNSFGDLAGIFLLSNVLNFDGTQSSNITIKTMNTPVSIGGGGSIAATSTVDLIAINTNNTVNLTSSLVCDGTFNMDVFFDCILDLNSSNTLTINGTLNMNGLNNNIAKVQGTGTLLIGATGTLNSTSASFPNVIASAVTNNHNMNALVKETDLTGTVTSSGTLTATVAGTSFSIGPAATLNSSGDLAGTFLLFNVLNFNGAQASNITIKTMANPVSIGGSGSIAASSTVDLIAFGTNNVVNFTSSLVCNGTFDMDVFFNCIVDINPANTFTINGTLNMGATTTNLSKVQGGGTLVIGAAGVLNSNTPSPANLISCAVTNNHNMVVQTGELDLSGVVTSSGTLTATAALTQFGIQGTLNTSGNLAGVFLLTGAINFNGNGTQSSDITIKTTAASTSIGGTGNPAIGLTSHVSLLASVANTINITAPLHCAGTLNVNAFFNNTLDLNAANTLTIDGTLNLNGTASNNSIIQTSGTGSLVISFGGTLNSNTAGPANVVSCSFSNSGNMNSQTGTLSLTAASASVTGTGVITASAGALVSLGAGSTLNTAGDLSGTFQLRNTINFNGTNLSNVTIDTRNTPVFIGGTGSFGAGCTVDLIANSGNNTVNFTSSLVCNGTFNMDVFFNSIVDINVGNTFTLNGTLNMGSAGNNFSQLQGPGTLQIGAGGILNSTAANLPNVIACAVTNNHNMIAQVGELDLNGVVTSTGTLTATAGTQIFITGPGTLNSAGNLVGLFLLSGALNFNGNGTQTGNMTVKTEANPVSIGGSGNPTIALGSTVTLLAANGNNTINITAPLHCAGTLTVNTFFNSVLDLNAANTLTIDGTLNMNGTASNMPVIQTSGTGSLVVSSTGIVNSSSNGPANVISCPFNNSGQINALTGTTNLTAATDTVAATGTLKASAGANFTLGGGTTLNSGGDLAGDFLLNNTINFAGNDTQKSSMQIKTMSTPVFIGGAGPLAPSSTVNLFAASGNNVVNFTSSLVSNGTFNMNSFFNCIVDINPGNTFTVNGTLKMNGTASNPAVVQGSGTLAVGVAGVLNSSSGGPANVITSAGFTQSGTLASTAGALNLVNNYVQNSGTLRLAGGNITVNGGAGTANINGGVLDGAGTLSANVTSAGIVRPGLPATPIGTLNITGTYTQTAAGTLELEVGGSSSFDKFNVTGAATLNGTLHALVQGGFVPAANQVFTPVMSFASRSGDFSTLNTVNPGVYFLHSFAATSMSLMSKLDPVTPGTTATTRQPNAVSGTLPGTDANGDPLTFSAATPAHGTVTITNTASGAFTYTPNPAFVGFDTFTYQASDGIVSSMAGTVTVTVIPKLPPQVLTLDVDQNPTQTGFVVNFTASATDPNGLPVTLTWDFGDATPAASGPSVSHAFAAEAIYTVTVTASDGLITGSLSLPMQVFAPNSGADGVPNIDDGKPPIINPDNGITISLLSSDGGVIELLIDVDSLTRAAVDVSTEFDGIGTRTGGISGLRPINKFVNPGLYVAVAMAKDPVTGQLQGKGRKTIAISRAETGQTPLFKNPPKSNGFTGISLKGTFAFPKSSSASAGKPDTVTLTGTFEIAEGVDLTVPQEFDIGVGNIIDSVLVAKGKGKLPSASKSIKKLTIRYPKLAKGTKLTAAGTKATFTVVISGTGLSAAGFDTEGITNVKLPSEKSLKGLNRSVQLAGVFAGAAFETLVPVQLTISNSGDAGTIGTRK